MNVPAERPLLLYCEQCGAQGRFRGTDDHGIAVELDGSGWSAQPGPHDGLHVRCPTCRIEELRVLAKAHRDDGPGEADQEDDVIRARRIEIVNGDGKVVLFARAGKRGGQLTLLGQDGAPAIMAQAASRGGVLGVADRDGHIVWRAPCNSENCRPPAS